MKKHDFSYFFVAVLVSLIFIAISLFVIMKDNTPYVYDMANLRVFSLDYFNYLNEGNYNNFYNLFRRDYFYPPFYVLGALPFYMLFGTSQDVSTFVNMPFALVLILSSYFIGKKLWDQKTGLLGCMFVALTPAVFSFSRVFMMDFAVCASASLSICLMLYTDRFTKKMFNFFFGLSLGLGVMIKWTYVVYIIGPFSIYLLSSFRKKEWFSVFTLKNNKFNIFLLGGAIGMILPLIWYYDKIYYIISRASRLNLDYSVQIGGFNPFTIENLKWYLHSLYFPLLRYFFALFLISFTYFIFFIKSRQKSVIAAWFLVPYIIYTFSAWKDSRYLLGALPALGLIAAATVSYLSERILKNKIGVFIIAALLISLSAVTFAAHDKGKEHNFNLATLSSDGLYTWHNIDYSFDEMMDALDTQANEILVIPNSILLDSFLNEVYLQKPSIKIDRGLFCIASGGANNCRERELSRFSDKELICNFDMVISYEEKFDHFRYGVIYLPKDSSLHHEVIRPLIDNWEHCKKDFKVIATFKDITNNDMALHFYQKK